MKRILGLMLSLTLCMTLLCGCQVQKGNYLKPVKRFCWTTMWKVQNQWQSKR